MTAEIATLAAVRAALVASIEVLSFVPAASIINGGPVPVPMPSIIIGEGELVDAGAVVRSQFTVAHTLHLWRREESLAGVRTLAGAVRRALSARLPLAAGLICGGCRVSAVRFMRSPDGKAAHGVLVVELMVTEPGQ